MRKTFCDHCGKDITREGVNSLLDEDCHYLYSEAAFVGSGCELCDECYAKREQLHAELDIEFLHLADLMKENDR